jgi:DNA-binding MarR family transcriptional regulator
MAEKHEAAESLAGPILQVVPRLSRLMDRELLRAGSPLSLRQLRVLERLRSGDRVAAEIARYSSVGPAAMQSVLDALAERQFVLRQRSTTDRRKQLLQLTPEGEAALERANRVLNEALSSLASDLTAHERESIAEALVVLRRAVDHYIAERHEQPKAGVSADGGGR